MLNLTGTANVSTFSGMSGLADTITLSPLALLAALCAWTLAPMALADFVFSRREL
jgi:Cu-processing system permease protein